MNVNTVIYAAQPPWDGFVNMLKHHFIRALFRVERSRWS